jgi:putative FmdB family regulatory protein
MPTYDYECDACHHAFEHFQSISEEPLKKCPKCKKSKLRRLPGTGAAIVFKGSGFYQTDYRSESYKSKAEADQKAASDSGGSEAKADKSGAAAESKPAEAPKTEANPAKGKGKSKS